MIELWRNGVEFTAETITAYYSKEFIAQFSLVF